MIVKDSGPVGVLKGEPAISVSTPVVASIA